METRGYSYVAQSDLIIKLIRSAADSDQVAFRKVAEDLISEETRKGHSILAERMRKALNHPITATKAASQTATP